MFASWGSLMHRLRWTVLAGVLLAVVGSAIWGFGVFGQLTEGGYIDPRSESARAAAAMEQALGPSGGDAVVIYTPRTGTVDDERVAQRVTARLADLPDDAVREVVSYWQTGSPQLATPDKSRAIALLTLAGADDGAKLDSYREIADDLAVDGVDTQVAGAAPLQDTASSRSRTDLTRAELISLPVVLVLLVLVFGSLVAAAVPVLVGASAVLGALGVLHAIALGTEVNSLAVNVASLLGLGMAIDYGLFMVSRFREEMSAGRPTATAVRNTVATAGRTVAFSATVLIIALACLLLFPQGFLKSLAYGGVAAVALAAAISLTLLPALLGLLGPRIDRLAVPGARRLADPGAERAGWARLARFVMRRPILLSGPIIAVLLLLAAPIANVSFGEVDERMLPANDPARRAIETLQQDFPAMSGTGVQVVLRSTDDAAPQPVLAEAFAARIAGIDGVADVRPAGAAGAVVVFTATLASDDALGDPARDVVRDVRALPPPAGTQVLVGGTTARNVDSLAATADRLPAMIVLLVGATLLLMFLAFGSVLLPIKAVLLSGLSLSATFGLLVWLFQEGHGAGLLGVTPAPLEVGVIVLMAVVVFGLSTDYEVFLLSRMVEARANGASTPEAVTRGLVSTGRVITAAALLLIVVTGAFALSSLATMRFVGVGMIIALVIDATVVRILLVPAILRLLGDASWWAPGPLRRLQQRAGLQESEEPPAPGGPRHAATELTGSR